MEKKIDESESMLLKRIDTACETWESAASEAAGKAGANENAALALAECVVPVPAVLASTARLSSRLASNLVVAVSDFQRVVEQIGAAADSQARRLTFATWVLAGATVALVAATVALCVVTAMA